LTVGLFGFGVLARSTLPISDSLLASTVCLPVFEGCSVPPAVGVLTGAGDDDPPPPPPLLLPPPPLSPWSEPDGLSEPPPPPPCDGASGVGADGSWGVGTGSSGVGTGVGVSTGPRSVMLCTGAGRPGIWIWDTGVPGGTSTVTVSTCPVTSVTWTRCISAEATVVSRA
jgi:hypothetical protein